VEVVRMAEEGGGGEGGRFIQLRGIGNMENRV